MLVARGRLVLFAATIEGPTVHGVFARERVFSAVGFLVFFDLRVGYPFNGLFLVGCHAMGFDGEIRAEVARSTKEGDEDECEARTYAFADQEPEAEHDPDDGHEETRDDIPTDPMGGGLGSVRLMAARAVAPCVLAEREAVAADAREAFLGLLDGSCGFHRSGTYHVLSPDATRLVAPATTSLEVGP